MTHDAGSKGGPSGEVEQIAWGDKGTSGLLIDAKEVTTAGTWYATYSWDGDDKTLTLAKPTQQKPPQIPAAARAATDPVDIEKIKIETWGTSKLDTPLEWTGPANGVATIEFSNFADISGPIGKVMGP